jgi:LysM repeat protein
VLGLLFALLLSALETRSTVVAQAETPVANATPVAQVIVYTVQAGDTLSKLARQYGTTVEDLVAQNQIVDPNLIYVGQELIIRVSVRQTPTPAPLPDAGPLAFRWWVVDWRPADVNYIATLHLVAQGGQPPYTFYHDGLVQQGDTFEFAWRRYKAKPGSVGVQDAAGTYVKQDYWLETPTCPVGVEIVDPQEGEYLEHSPRHFNIRWRDTVAPPSAEYGIEIEVRQDGEWRPWQEYKHERDGDDGLFFVPDEFPGDLEGRVRMWGIYEQNWCRSKTSWRHFEFRVTD